MPFAQPNLFGDDQSDLFGAAPKPAYCVNPQHVINRFIDFEAQMKAAQCWPWNEFWVGEYRSRIWPYLWNKLTEIGCDSEATKWKAVMEAECARMDAAGPPKA